MLCLALKKEGYVEILCPDGAVVKVMLLEVKGRTRKNLGSADARLGFVAPQEYQIVRSDAGKRKTRDRAEEARSSLDGTPSRKIVD